MKVEKFSVNDLKPVKIAEDTDRLTLVMDNGTKVHLTAGAYPAGSFRQALQVQISNCHMGDQLVVVCESGNTVNLLFGEVK